MYMWIHRVEPPAVLVHGGAGRWTRRPGWEERAEKALDAVRRALETGYGSLAEGSEPHVAVVEAVKVLEDSGVLNAGIGSALNLLGEAEMDAGIMTSYGLLGAVAATRYPRNPVELALHVALETDHLLVAGRGADRLAELLGLRPRGEAPKRIRERYAEMLRDLREKGGSPGWWRRLRALAERYGVLGDTVGAAALSADGKLAAATSTGGIWLKLPGRVGDTPIIGAGFYADESVAVSATGFGEAIMRSMASLRLAWGIRKGMDLEEACRRAVEAAEEAGGKGVIGLIAVSRSGEACIAHDTEAMPSGVMWSSGINIDLRRAS